MPSSPISDDRSARLERAIRDPYALAGALATGLVAAWFGWPLPVWILAAAAVIVARVASEFALPRGASLELADDVAAQEAQVRNALSAVHSLVLRGAPDEVVAGVDRVTELVREITARQAALGGSSPQLFAVLRTATDYLPNAIDAYMRLPQGYARNRRLADGHTALEVLIGQLDLLEKEMVDVSDAVTKNDLDRLLAHGRFLSEKFGRSALTLPQS